MDGWMERSGICGLYLAEVGEKSGGENEIAWCFWMDG